MQEHERSRVRSNLQPPNRLEFQPKAWLLTTISTKASYNICVSWSYINNWDEFLKRQELLQRKTFLKKMLPIAGQLLHED